MWDKWPISRALGLRGVTAITLMGEDVRVEEGARHEWSAAGAVRGG